MAENLGIYLALGFLLLVPFALRGPRQALGLILAAAIVVFGNEAKLRVWQFTVNPLDIAFLLFLFVCFASRAVGRTPVLVPRQKRLVIALIVCSVWFLITSVNGFLRYGNEIADVLKDLRVVSYLIGMIWFSAALVRRSEDFEFFGRVIVATGLVVSMEVLIIALGELRESGQIGRSGLVVGDVLPYAVTYLYVWSQRLRGVRAAAAYAALMVCALAVVLTLTRGLLLHLVAALLGAVMLLRWSHGHYLRTAILAGTAFVVVLGIQTLEPQIVGELVGRVSALADPESDSGVSSRVAEALMAIEDASEAPIMGRGPGFRLTAMGLEGFQESLFQHNSLTYFLVKFGLVGLTLVLILIGMILWAGIRSKPNETFFYSYRAFLLGSLIPGIAVGMFSAGLNYVPKIILIGSLLGQVIALSSIAVPQRRRDQLGQLRTT